MDKIIIKGLRLYAYHGVNTQEKERGQMFILDITCVLSLCVPCKTDCVATEVLRQYAPVRTITVCVKKPQAPIKADFDYVAVEITRERQTDETGEIEE